MFLKSFGEVIQRRERNERAVQQIGFSIRYSFLNRMRLAIESGLGWAKETNYFSRDFNFGHFYPPGHKGNYLNRYVDRYDVSLVQLPLEIRYRLWSFLSLKMEFLPQFSYKKDMLDRRERNYSLKEFDFYSLEINPGIQFHWKRFFVDFSVRALQVKKWDKILFGINTFRFKGPPEGPFGTNLDMYNPWKGFVTAGVNF